MGAVPEPVEGPPPVPRNSEVEVKVATFDGRLEDVAAARTWLAEVLERHEWNESDLQVVQLLLSEVATNAILHAKSSFAVTAWVDGVASVAVTDTSPTTSPAIEERPWGQGGFGLRFVAALANQWGVYTADEGKSVWFVVDPNHR